MKRTREIRADNGDFSVVLKVQFNGRSHLLASEQTDHFEELTNALFDAMRLRFDTTEIRLRGV